MKIGYITKQNPNDVLAYSDTHFFIMPTNIECVGMSFIEAGSVGLPTIGTEVGGVPEAIIDGKTGLIIKENYSAKDVAEWIHSKHSNLDHYEALASESYKLHQKKLNWNNWSNSVYEIIKGELI